MSDNPSLAAIAYEARFPIDELIIRAARALAAEGLRVGGAVQENLERPRDDGSCCATMTVIDLQSGGRFKISQDLGVDSRGCRLDPQGLVEIEGTLFAAIDRGVDIFILNKFGRAEAEGGGLRSVLAYAIEAGVPVLTAVRPPYDEAWREFQSGLASELAPDFDGVIRWCRSVTSAPVSS